MYSEISLYVKIRTRMASLYVNNEKNWIINKPKLTSIKKFGK
jgi:hypothetical protein